MTPGLNPSRTVLANGVTVISKQTTKTPAVTINVAVRVGAASDPPGLPGAMYLLSRVIDRGTEAKSAADIADALESRGSSLAISVSRELFSISCTCLADDFEPVLALIGEIVTTPSIPESELATRKGQVATSLRQDEDNPASRAVESLMVLLYGDSHPFGRRIKGTLESLDLLTRDRLLALHRATFGPRALMVVVAGDVEPSRIEACAASVFGGWSAPELDDVPVLVPPAAPTTRRFVTIPMMNKAQTDIAYGFPAVARRDRSYYAFLLMNNVLGQYAIGGRLGQSIRERQGMAYYAASYFDAGTIAGPFMVRAGVAAANVDRAIASIDEELSALRKSGVTGRELAESRQYLSGSMPRALETNAGIASFLQNEELFGLGLDYDQRFPNLLTAVTIDEVNAAADGLDPDRASIVVAGPYQPA